MSNENALGFFLRLGAIAGLSAAGHYGLMVLQALKSRRRAVA